MGTRQHPDRPHWRAIALAKDAEKLEQWPVLFQCLADMSATARAAQENTKEQYLLSRRLEHKIDILDKLVTGKNGQNGPNLLGRIALLETELHTVTPENHSSDSEDDDPPTGGR